MQLYFQVSDKNEGKSKWLMSLNMSVLCSNLKADSHDHAMWDHAGMPLVLKENKTTATPYCSLCYQHRAGAQLQYQKPDRKRQCVYTINSLFSS